MGETDQDGRLTSCLPCDVCRFAGAQAHQLAGLRLGAIERRVLLEAASDDAKDGRLLVPPHASRALQAAISRPARRLKAAGLLVVGCRGVTVRLNARYCGYQRAYRDQKTGARMGGFRYYVDWRYRHLVGWRFPFGDAVVGRLRSTLASGARILWDAVVPGLVEATVAPLVSRLMRFREAVDQTHHRASLRLWLARYTTGAGTSSARVTDQEKAHAYIAATTPTVALRERVQTTLDGLQMWDYTVPLNHQIEDIGIARRGVVWGFGQ